MKTNSFKILDNGIIRKNQNNKIIGVIGKITFRQKVVFLYSELIVLYNSWFRLIFKVMSL